MAKTKIYGPNGKVKYASGKLLDAFLRLGYTTEPPKPKTTAQPTSQQQQPARAQQAQQTAGQGGRSSLRNVFGEENINPFQLGSRVPASRQPGSGVLKPETTRERFDRMLNEQRQFGTRAARRMQGRPTDAADYPYVERGGKKYRKMTGNRFSVGRDDVFVPDEQAQEVIDAVNEEYDERVQKTRKSRLAQARERLHANNELIEELRKKRDAHAANVGGSAHFQFSSPGVSPMSTYGGNSAELHEASSYSSAISQLERENEMLNAVIERKGVLGGMGDALFSADTALFGLPELSESLALRRIKDKIDRGEGLTEGERALFEAGSHKAAGENMYGDMLSNGYRWGQIAGYSVPFAAEMLLTGGGLTALRVGSRLATKGAAKIAAKGLAGNIGRGLVKGLGVTADEIGQSAILANTLGAGRTWADIERRNAGTPMGYDEQENPVFEGGKSRARSIWEGQGAATLERYSEKLGNHMHLIGDAAKWGGKKIAGSRGAQWLSGKADELRGSRVGKMYSRMSNSDVAQAAKWLSNKMNFNGYIPEVLEEEANIVMNSLLVGDNQLSDLVDKKTQLDIWGGMAVTSGFLGGANLAMGGLYSAANRAHRRNVKNQLHKADLVAGLRLTDDRWRGLRERIDNATFEETPLILSEVLASDEYATEEKRAVMQYAEALSKFRGLNLSENAIANGGGASPMDAEAYAHRLAGAEATADERANIRARSEAAAARVKAEFGISDSVDLEDWLKTYGETRGEQMQNLFPDEATPQDNADVKMVLDYINARETYEGMLEGVEDATEAAVLRSNMIVSDNTAPDGNIYMGTTRGGNPVYVVSGISDGATTVVVRDAATGEIQQLLASDVEMNGQIMNGEEFRAQEEARIREEAAAAADASISGAPMFNDGDVYEGIDESGQTYTLTINQNFGDGTAEITHSEYGTQRVKLDALDDLQADMDRARAVRMSMEDETEEAAEGTSVAAPAAQANTPAHRQGDMVEARMPGGTVRGEIFEVSDEDGAPVYSVQWESPVQGVMVGRYSGEELSALQPAAEPENVAAELRSSEETDENDGRVEVHIIDPRDMSDEERAKRGDWLRDAPAIDVEEGTIVSTSELSARKAAEKWWMENVPEPVFYDTEAGEVEISKKSIENSLSHRYGQPKPDAITSLVEGFENAVYLGTMQDGTRDGNVQNHYFAYPINYKGERCYVFCRAMQDANKNRLYVHEVFIAENIKKGDTLQTAASQPHGGIALYRDILANVLDASTSSASKDTPQSVSVQENEQKSLQPIPTRTTKKGTEVLYHEVPVARTLDELYDGTLTQPEVDAFVAANVDESRKQAEKTEGTPPKMGTDLAAYKQAKAEWQGKVDEARRKADYWLEVQAEVQRITSRQNESASRSIESASRLIEMPTSMSEAQDGAEYAAMAFAGKMGLRITPESFRGETGLGATEQRQLTGVIATAENGGITIEQAAEWLYAAQENDGVSFYADETEARDAIIDVLSQGNPKGYVARSRKEAAKRDSQAEAADKEAWAQQHFHMSFEEYQAMEEQAIPAIIEQYRGFDEATYYANLADNYEQQNERRNDTEKDSAAESAGIGRSGELLQGEQPASTGGTRHIGDGQQGRAAASDVQGGVSAEDASGTSGGGKPDNVRRLETRREQIAEAPTIGEQIQAAEAEVNTNPTEAQKEAGNYKKGHVQIGTFNVTIEQPKGSVRSGVDADGKKWETEMQNTYGYIRGTEGVDGDHIDVFLSDDIDGWDGHKVFVVDQRNADGSFDEHKVMLGFNDINDAEAAYMSNYEEGWQGLGAITGVSIEEFEKWIASSHRKTKAFAEYKSVKTTEGQSASADKDLRRKLADFNVGDVVRDYYNQKLYRIKKHSTNGVSTIAELDAEGNEVGTTTMNAHNNSRYSLAEAPVKAETRTISQDSEQVSDQDNAPYTIAPAQYTTKKGKVLDMHLVKFTGELTKEQQRAAKELAKADKGWYDREQGGFMMRSEESAKQLADTILVNEEAVSEAQPVSMTDIQALNNGDVLFTEPQQVEQTDSEEKSPVWQYSIHVDKETGRTTLRRDDVSGVYPIGDARWQHTAASPEEMLDILRNPLNGMQDVLEAVGVTLENKIKTRELDRKNKEQAPTAETNPSGNRLVTDERYAELRERMRKKLGGQMNIGIDPEILAIGTEMAVYHLEKGARKFTEFAKAMVADLGDVIRPYLKAFYNGARNLPEVESSDIATDMTSYDEVQTFDIANFDKPGIDAIATAETVTREAEVAQEVEVAQERIKKTRSAKKETKKKTVNSQQSDELSLFDDLFDNAINKEDGLQRNDDVRAGGLQADNSGHRKGLQTSTETSSESEQQDSRGTDNGRETTGDAVNRTVRPRLSDTVEDKGIDGKRKKDVENNRKLADELKGVTLFVPDTFGVEHELSGFTYYELENVFHFTDNINGQRNATRKELDAILKIARKNNGKEEISEPKNTRNNHSERGKDHAPTSVDARIEANIKAIELAKQLLESGEQATEKQMQTLRKFSGWGGLGKAFSEGTYYAPNLISKRLRELLGEAAYQEAVMSANSAYYTPAYVVDTLWDIAEQMGFKGGNILEGSAGIGNILGQMPTHISERSNIHAIEIDGTSGGILSLLYPDAKVEIQGFEETRIANGSVDLAITNVPFVTGLRVNDTTGDKDLSKKFHNIHDFCIAKNVRKLREGGLGIFITSNGTLDNSKKLRDWIVNEGGADFVGAFRMHNKTFGGTGVTSDIIVIRKRVNGKKSANAIDVSTVTGERMAEYDTGETRKVKGQIVPVVKQLSMDYNQYFVEHPENMAGEMHFAFEKGDTFRPTSKGLYPKQEKKQEQMLAEFVQSFTAEEFGEKAADEIEVIDAMPGKKIGEVFVSDGKLYINAIGAAQPLEVNANKVKGHTKVECFEAYSAIKEALAAVLEYQITHEDDKGLKPLLAKLNKAYDDFVATYGHFNKNTAIAFLRNDVDYANVFALEKFEESADAKGNKVQKFGKTDVFSKRVIEKEAEPMPTNVKDGIVASIFKFGRVDIPYIAEQLGKSEAEVKAEIIESGYGFEDPATRQVEVSYQYLSGNVREKLRQAQENNENGEFDRNIKALQEVMPMTIPAHLIDFTLGSSWIEPKLYEEYVKERTDVGVQFTAVGGTWFMNEPYYTAYEKNRAMGVTSEMLGRTVMGHTLIEAAIQNKSITVSTVKKNWDGSTETITDKEATQACSAKIDEIRQDFKEWARQKMQSDAEMSERMERVYNDTFNNYVPMSIPDEFVPEYFGGASHKFKMRSHQGRAIVRGTMQPLLLAHEVGTGKTFTLISTAMEMRRLGTARKPMIVVQNATVGQFVASAKELYPNAKILTLEEADRSADGRKNFYAKIKYNDWDMIVVPQSTFEFIPDSEERQMAFVQEKIEEKMLVLEQMKEADPDGKSMITRQAEREIELLEAELAGIADNASKKRTANDEKKRAVALQNAEVKAMEMLDRRTDDVENFDDMGIDALLIDEAHEYKHLGFATAMQRGVKGVDPSYSKKSQGVFLKTQAVLEKNNGRNVIFATGTPISNTAAEIWTFMRYLMPADTMKEYDIYYFDDFVRNFGNIQQMLEFTTSGKFKENNRFAGYVNLPELVRIWSGVSDTVLTKEAGGVSDKIPDMEGGKAQDLYLPQTRALRSIMKYVKAELERYDKMSGKEKKENSHIPLTMYGIAKAAAVDARLVQSDAEDDAQSKTNEAVRQTLRSLKESADYKGTVAIFADNYQNKESGFNLYEDIRTKLIAEGVPADEIVVIKSGMTVKKKLEIFEKVNRGEVRVILGSTFTLGTGVNIQERLYTLIHLDAPNRPMDYTQRNGRILRQGNLHKAMGKPVRVLRFGVEDSLDVTAYQRLKTKGAIADSIMNGKQMMANSMTNRVLEEEEDVFGDTVAQLSGSEYAMLKNNAEKNVRKYASRKKQWEADQTYIHNAKPRVKAFIKDAEKRIEDNSRYLEAVRASFPDGKFKEIVIGKHRFATIEAMEDFFKEHNKSLLAEMKQMKDGDIAGEQKRQLTIQIGDFSFVVTTKLTRQTVRDGATLFNDVERKMTYSCAELGIEDIPVRQNLLRNAIEDITHNVITGRDFSERLEAAERSKKHNEAELEQLLSREGKLFEYEAELEQAKAQYEEYAELMKKELEQKEAKYAEMDANVEVADNLSNTDEDENIRYRFQNGMSQDELFDALNEHAEYYNAGPANLIFALEDYFGGELVSASSGARNAIENSGLVPVPGGKYSGVEEEYHHIEFRNSNGETFVESVPFVRPEDVAERGIEFREGDGMYTDDALSMENDPVAKMLGKPRFTRKQRREFAERERQRMVARVENLAKKLHLDNVEIVTDASTLEGKKQRAKGFYTKSTGKITIVIPNHSSTFDVEQTLLHEAVAHYGLRQLFGEHFDTFLDNVYQSADRPIRERINSLASKNGWDFRTATEEYLASLAEQTNFENRDAGWWSEIKRWFLDMLHNIGFEGFTGVTLTDNELRYILWRSYENLAEPGRYRSILGEAADVAKQYELGVGNYAVTDGRAYVAAEDQAENIEAVNARFNAELQQQIDGTLPTGHIYQLGMPGEILRSTGIADAPIQLNSQRLMDKSSKFGHNFDLSEVKDLVRAINNPIAIFRYGDKTKAQNVVVEIQHGGKNFIVGISIRPVVGGNVLDINSIRNVFPKDNAEWLNWITEDKALYLNKEKIQDLIDQQRTNLADVEYLDLDDVANILESFENPQIPGVKNDEEEVLFRNGDPEIHERALARDRYERRVKTGMFQSQEALQDSMLGLKEAMQAILGKKTNIEDVDGFENAYLGENRLSSVNKAEADAFARLLFKPMLDEVAKLARNEAEREELTDYMMAKHGLERNAYMRNEAIKNGATDADQTDYAGLTALTGMDDVADAEAEAQRMVDDYEQAHETADLWEKVNAVSKAILQKSYECGMMSKETFDKVSDMYEFYIPLRGFDEKTSAEAYAYLSHKHSAFNAPIKKAEGRRSKADDPFANLQSMAEGAIMQGNRNKLVKQRFLNFALNHPSDLVSVIDIWVEYDAVTDEWKPVFPDNIESTDTPEEVEQKMQDFETKMESLAQQHPDQYKRGKDAIGIPYRIVESRDMRQHQVVVRRGGRDYVITINGNPRAAQALNGQTNPDNDMSGAIGAILRAGEKINRQLSAFYTTRNPDFIVSNFMRDMLYTNSMAWIKESPNYALRFHRNYLMVNPVTMKRLLAKYRKGTLDMSNRTEAMFHQFMMNGGETGYANIRDIEQHKNDIRKELKRANGKLKLARAWSLLAEKFDELNRAVENCARFAAFVTSREMGRSIDRAIYDAKEISVNFNKKGSGAKFYDSVGQTKAGNASALVSGLGRSGYVFWNAAIQGTTNFGRQMKRHPAKAFTGMAAMFLLGAIVAYLGGDDDEDDKNAYYNLPEYVRRSNILFRAGDSWISIPLPIEYRAFYGMGELMTSVFSGKEHLTGGEIAEAVLGQATQILPIDFLEGGGGLNAFVPSAAKPLWEAYVAEKSWTGMPLYKDTPFNKDMPEWTKTYKSANKHIVNLAAVLNEATGGDPYTKGAIDINPAKVEYMLNGYFGGVFGTIDKLTKTAETIVGDREYDPRSILLVNRLVKAGDERTEYRAINNRYYKVVEEAENTKRRLKAYEKDTRAGIFDYAEKIDFLYNSPEFERMQIYELHRKYIKALNDALKDAKMDGNEEASKDIEMELLNTKKLMLEQMEPSYDRK